MIKSTMKLMLAVFTTSLLASGAYATPVSLSDSQMDSVAAGGVEKVDGFVCPVITTDAVFNHNPNKGIDLGGGEYSIVGPDVSVPVHATNDNGNGAPDGPHASPGDSGYTAIWAN